jgi:hypothetical protein
LSFEQMQDEFLQNLPPPPVLRIAPAPEAQAAPEQKEIGPEAIVRDPEFAMTAPAVAADHRAAAAPPQTTGEPDQAPKLLAVLEQWLDAIHGSRAQHRS